MAANRSRTGQRGLRRRIFPKLAAGGILAAGMGVWLLAAGLQAGTPRGAGTSQSSPAPAHPPYTSHARIISKFFPKDFTPDGNVAKAVWRRADWARFDHDMTGRRLYPQAKTEVASRWTPTSIYFAFRCKYVRLNIYKGEDPAREKWGLWERDVVEVFLNPTPERMNHYYEFEVAPNNLWLDLEINLNHTPFNDASWNSGFEHATRINRRHHIWTCEMRIPLAALGAHEPRPGERWRVNLFRGDGRGAGNSRRLLAWSTIPEGHTFHTPARFGVLDFQP
jgi:hypothetical protein